MKRVGRCVEQPRGEREKVPVPICFTTKRLSFAVTSKVCFVTALLSFPLWAKAKSKKIIPCLKAARSHLYSYEKIQRDVSTLLELAASPRQEHACAGHECVRFECEHVQKEILVR